MNVRRITSNNTRLPAQDKRAYVRRANDQKTS